MQRLQYYMEVYQFFHLLTSAFELISCDQGCFSRNSFLLKKKLHSRSALSSLSEP